MKQFEWVIVVFLSALALYALSYASSWQKGIMQEEQQKELDIFKSGATLFDVDWTFTQETPEQIKREECRASRECFKLSEALVYESRGESYIGAVAVASVILNRKDHKNFPNTIWGVVTQPYQFSYLMDMHKQAKPTRADWDRAFVIAYDVKHGVVERTTDALFYLNPRAVKRLPRWAREYQYVMTVDNHQFYKYN